MTITMKIISTGSCVCYLSKEGLPIYRRTFVCESVDRDFGGEHAYPADTAAFTVWGKLACDFPYKAGDVVEIQFAMRTFTSDNIRFYTNLYAYSLRRLEKHGTCKNDFPQWLYSLLNGSARKKKQISKNHKTFRDK